MTFEVDGEYRVRFLNDTEIDVFEKDYEESEGEFWAAGSEAEFFVVDKKDGFLLIQFADGLMSRVEEDWFEIIEEI
jgi:hypothetical protein